MPRLPQSRAILRLGGPLERAAAVLCGDRLHHLRPARARPHPCHGIRRAASVVPRILRAWNSGCTRPSAMRRAARCEPPAMPICMAVMTVSTADLRSGNWHTAADIASGIAVQAQLHLGDDAERAFRAHEQAREVVARGGFAGTPAGAHDAPVGRDDGQAEDVLAHGAVAHGVGARCARRGHAADGGVGTGVDRKEQPGALELGVHLFSRDPGLHAAVEVGGIDLQHAGSSARGRCRRRHTAPRHVLRATCPTPNAITGIRAA